MQTNTAAEGTAVGRIVKGIGGFYTVWTETGEVVCRARGRFRKEGVRPLPGDYAQIRLLPDGTGYLDKLLPRRNTFIRPPVCNIELLVILASEAIPRTEPYLIDKMLAMAVSHNTNAAIVINKCDLSAGETLRSVYQNSGFPLFMTSALTGEGIDALWPILDGKFVAFTGNSGVGKSALLECLHPGGDHQTGEISQKLGRGRHTTRHVELFALARNVLAADTPGFAALDGIENIPPEDLAACYPDFVPYLDGCRFRGCLHEGDLGCAVGEAVKGGDIHTLRYENYRRLLTQSKACKRENR